MKPSIAEICAQLVLWRCRKQGLETAPATDFWGIGRRTEKTIAKDRDHVYCRTGSAHPDLLKKSIRVMGLQLWFHAHGIDESNVHKPYRPKSRGIGNSQILPHDYHLQADIELVFREMAEQVAIRLRRKKKEPTGLHSCLLLQNRGTSVHSLPAKDWALPNPPRFIDTVLRLFRSKYEGGAIRQIGVLWRTCRRVSSTLFSLWWPSSLGKRGKTPTDHWPHSGSIWLYLSSERLLITRKLTRHCT